MCAFRLPGLPGVLFTILLYHWRDTITSQLLRCVDRLLRRARQGPGKVPARSRRYRARRRVVCDRNTIVM